MAKGITRIRFSRTIGNVLEQDQDQMSGQIEGLARQVVAMLQQTDVWKWAEAAMAKGRGHGLDDEGADGLDLDEEDMDLGDEGMDLGDEEADLDEGADLESLGADLDEADEDLDQAGQAAQRHLHRMSKRLAATTAGQAAAQRHLERDGNDHPLRLTDGAKVRRYFRGRHAALRRYEARFRHGGHDRYPEVRGYRGRLTEPTPTDEQYGQSVPGMPGDVHWKPMDNLLPDPAKPYSPYTEGGEGRFMQQGHPNDDPAAHKAGKNESVYERQARIVKVSQELAEKWVNKFDVGQQARDEAGRYCSGDDEE
jgi:hypothetical protein